ncbi:hypothetical protein PAMP_020333 [Pampus punctatissimus]
MGTAAAGLSYLGPLSSRNINSEKNKQQLNTQKQSGQLRMAPAHLQPRTAPHTHSQHTRQQGDRLTEPLLRRYADSMFGSSPLEPPDCYTLGMRRRKRRVKKENVLQVFYQRLQDFYFE